MPRNSGGKIIVACCGKRVGDSLSPRPNMDHFLYTRAHDDIIFFHDGGINNDQRSK